MASSWQKQISAAAINLHDLLAQTSLSADASMDARPDFALKAPSAWLARAQQGNQHDPLLRQVLPLVCEQETVEGFERDPLDEVAQHAGHGIIQKYHKRVLLLVTEACAIHCRYCFRRHFPYRENTLAKHLPQALETIRDDTDIEEVILSGGDPLTLTNAKLMDLCERLEAIPHVERIRFHTRVPIAVPDRVDTELSTWLEQRSKSYIVVLHINHPAEIDDAVGRALAKLSHLPLLNQSVLLKGVNDIADTLIELSRACFAEGVLPYYLHLLDPVEGAAHFAVDESRACRLMREVSRELPGYLVPKLVREIAGEANKTVIPY